MHFDRSEVGQVTTFKVKVIGLKDGFGIGLASGLVGLGLGFFLLIEIILCFDSLSIYISLSIVYQQRRRLLFHRIQESKFHEHLPIFLFFHYLLLALRESALFVTELGGAWPAGDVTGDALPLMLEMMLG